MWYVSNNLVIDYFKQPFIMRNEGIELIQKSTIDNYISIYNGY